MMKSAHWTHRLSEYLDDELSADDRAACEAHLQLCEECADVVEELGSVVAGAALLPDLPPERDLWAGIEDRLQPRAAAGADPAILPLTPRSPSGRRVAVSFPQLIAAAIVLVVFSAGSVWLLVPGRAAAPVATGVDAVADSAGAGAVTAAVAFAATYQQAISELEVELQRRRQLLEPETVRVVEANLTIIDQAIAEANEALAKDPSSGFLQAHLANAMRQKVDLLRRVAAIEQKES